MEYYTGKDYGPKAGMAYTQVMPQEGFKYVYDQDGRRYSVPDGSQPVSGDSAISPISKIPTDQEIRDEGFKFIPNQKYLQTPFMLPVNQEDDDGAGTPPVNVGGNSEGFSVYNPDPNRTRTIDQYSPFNYRTASEKSYIGAPGDYSYSSETEAQKMMDMYPEYYTGKRQLEGIPGMVQNYLRTSIPGQLIGNIAGGIERLLPVNRRAILENELLGQGFRLNDIGQFVSDGGNAYDPSGSNIMAGYNAAKVTRQTFDKRRANAKKNMSPEGFEKFNKALTAAEEKFFGGSEKATMVFNEKLKQKDIDDGFINDQGVTYDEETFIDPNILRYITNKKTADTSGIVTDTSNDGSADIITDINTGNDVGGGIDISGAGTIRSKDNNFQGVSGPTTQQEADYGYATDYGFAYGGLASIL